MLYIVATPIGNLEDLSIRQARILSEVDVILAEDNRSAKILLDFIKKRFKFDVQCSMTVSYYKEKEFEKLPKILKLLEEDKSVALISESGLPLISDPGYLLVKALIKKELPFTVIPGPSALTTALVYSGFELKLSTGGFLFFGFFPKRLPDQYRCIDTSILIKKLLPDITLVFYESAKRISQTLRVLDEKLPQADICICRELTKKFEEIIRGKPKDLLNRPYKGEITIVLNFQP